MIQHDDAARILAEMVRTARTFRTAGQHSRERGLTGTKFGFLQQLSGDAMRLGELAQRLAVSAPVASRTVDLLEADGLVERSPDPSDARAFLVSITEAGRSSVRESEAAAVSAFAEALDDWSSADADAAVALLRRLNDHLADVTQAPARGAAR